MHTTTPIKSRNRTTITIPPVDPTKIAWGHRPHRGAAGVHGDRRTRRLRTRGERVREAVGDEL